MSDPAGETSALNGSSVLTWNASSAPGCDPVEKTSGLFFILVYTLLVLVGLVLNSFILWFHCCRARQRRSNSLMIYLRNLTAADLLLCLSLPLRIANYANYANYANVSNVSNYANYANVSNYANVANPTSTESGYTDTIFYCSVGASALVLNMYASILFMGYIAANRYLKIVCLVGTHFLMRVRVARIISMTTWVLLLAPTTAYVVLMQTSYDPGIALSSCEAFSSQTVKWFFRSIHVCAFVVFLLVLLSMLFFYSSTSRRVLEVQKNQPNSSSSRKLTKSRRNMLVLVSVFCMCFMPYHLARLSGVLLSGRCSLAPMISHAQELTYMLSVLNVCLDPLVYFVLCKSFRTQVSLRLRKAGVSGQQLDEGRRNRRRGQSPAIVHGEESLSTTEGEP